MQIEQIEISDFKNFKWGDEWRAITLSKEQRTDKDYYFAQIVRFYGKVHNTFEYDVGREAKEFAWIGRKKKYVGTAGPDMDPDSKTFGKRIQYKPETEDIIVVDSKGNDRKKTVLKKGRIVYDFTLPVNDENTKLIKTLIGPLTINKSTVFQVVAGNEPPVGITKSIFFKSTVDEIMSYHLHQIVVNEEKNKLNAK